RRPGRRPHPHRLLTAARSRWRGRRRLAPPAPACARPHSADSRKRAYRRRSVMLRTRPGRGLGQSDCMSTPSERQVVIAPRTLVTLAALGFGGVLLLLLAQAIRGVLTQLVVAVVLAMALEPLIKLFERRGLRRGAAVGVTFSLAVLTVTLFAWLLIPPLVTETTHFIQDAPVLVQKLSHGQGRLGFLEDRF